MNIDDKLDGILIQCGTVNIHHTAQTLAPSVLDKRGGRNLDMSLGEKSLANQPLLADDDDEEDEDDDLAGETLASHNLISHDELMVHEETVKNNAAGEQEFSQRLSHKLPYTLQIPVSSLYIYTPLYIHLHFRASS